MIDEVDQNSNTTSKLEIEIRAKHELERQFQEAKIQANYNLAKH